MRMMRSFGKAGDLGPQPRGLVILGIDRHQQPVRREAELAGDRFQASSIARSLK